MNLRPASVRVRLTLWYSLILAGTVLVLCLFVYLFVKASLFNQLDQQLENDFRTVSQAWVEEPNEASDIEIENSGKIFQIVKDGELFYQTPEFQKSGLPLVGPLPSAERSAIRLPSGARLRLRTGQVGPAIFLRMAVSEEPVRRTLRTLLTIMLLSIPIALALAAFGGFVMAGRLLEPVAVITAKAAQISADSLAARLPVKDPQDEFGRLAGVINVMLARLEDAFERLKRFTADASHELRTPLTVIRSVGEVALQEDLDAVSYRDRIGSMLEEVNRLAGLIENLLTLTRADSGPMPLGRTETAMGPLVERAAEDMRALAEDKDQVLTLDLQGSAILQVDEATVRLALVNLIDNAVKYTPRSGAITIGSRIRGDEFLIEVADTGPGIPPEHRERIFDRFYRIEADRNSLTGGAGLGLSIAKWAVEANGGRIELESGESRGTTFRIVLPIDRSNSG